MTDEINTESGSSHSSAVDEALRVMRRHGFTIATRFIKNIMGDEHIITFWTKGPGRDEMVTWFNPRENHVSYYELRPKPRFGES